MKLLPDFISRTMTVAGFEAMLAEASSTIDENGLTVKTYTAGVVTLILVLQLFTFSPWAPLVVAAFAVGHAKGFHFASTPQSTVPEAPEK